MAGVEVVSLFINEYKTDRWAQKTLPFAPSRLPLPPADSSATAADPSCPTSPRPSSSPSLPQRSPAQLDVLDNRGASDIPPTRRCDICVEPCSSNHSSTAHPEGFAQLDSMNETFHSIFSAEDIDHTTPQRTNACHAGYFSSVPALSSEPHSQSFQGQEGDDVDFDSSYCISAPSTPYSPVEEGEEWTLFNGDIAMEPIGMMEIEIGGMNDWGEVLQKVNETGWYMVGEEGGKEAEQHPIEGLWQGYELGL